MFDQSLQQIWHHRDIQWNQNEKKNEHKTTFFIKYELFEYVIMFFDFCNAFDIFQFFINFTLREYLNDFCTSYLNDILIYNNNKKKHIVHVSKMLQRFQQIKLFLDIKKCEFFVTSIKYLNLIIIFEKIKMNLTKIDAIVNWKSSKNVKNVQTFLNFANFYKKFILNYFRIITSLTKLTKSEKKTFSFHEARTIRKKKHLKSWSWRSQRLQFFNISTLTSKHE